MQDVRKIIIIKQLFLYNLQYFKIFFINFIKCKISTRRNISSRMIARLSNVEVQDVASQNYLVYIFEEGITRLRHRSVKCKHSIPLVVSRNNKLL